MRKSIMTAAVIAVAFIFATPADAQVKLGIKAGLNINSVNLKNLPGNLSASNKTGFFAGLQADVTVPLIGLGADIAVLYDNKTSQYAMTGDDGNATLGNTTLQYIDIPINVKYTFGFSSLASIYVASGPQFAFNISGKSLKGLYGESWNLKKSEFSWNFGAGVTFLKHYRVGYNFNLACGKTADLNVSDLQSAVSTAANLTQQVATQAFNGKLKNNTHQISVMYIF